MHRVQSRSDIVAKVEKGKENGKRKKEKGKGRERGIKTRKK